MHPAPSKPARLHTIEGAEKLGRKLRQAGKKLVPLTPNPVDAAWGADRPAAPDVSPPSACLPPSAAACCSSAARALLLSC